MKNGYVNSSKTVPYRSSFVLSCSQNDYHVYIARNANSVSNLAYSVIEGEKKVTTILKEN